MERLCRNCVHFSPPGAIYGYSWPAGCKRTAHRDLVHGTEMVSCSIERIHDDDPEFCSDEGRHWEPKPASVPAPKRGWLQRLGVMK